MLESSSTRLKMPDPDGICISFFLPVRSCNCEITHIFIITPICCFFFAVIRSKRINKLPWAASSLRIR